MGELDRLIAVRGKPGMIVSMADAREQIAVQAMTMMAGGCTCDLDMPPLRPLLPN